MRKPISRPVHGLADYAYATLLSTAPEWAGYQEARGAVTLSRLLSAGALAYTLCTRAEWGVFRLLPFKVHLAIDGPAAALTTLAPWVFGFSQNRRARNTFLAIGLFGTTVALLTRPEEQPPTLE
jgi:hypothetical protein